MTGVCRQVLRFRAVAGLAPGQGPNQVDEGGLVQVWQAGLDEDVTLLADIQGPEPNLAVARRVDQCPGRCLQGQVAGGQALVTLMKIS